MCGVLELVGGLHGPSQAPDELDHAEHSLAKKQRCDNRQATTTCCTLSVSGVQDTTGRLTCWANHMRALSQRQGAKIAASPFLAVAASRDQIV